MGREVNKKHYRSLVDIKAMEALELMGIVNKLNVNMYSLSINGVESSEGNSRLDHIVSLSRHKYLGEFDTDLKSEVVFSSKEKQDMIEKLKAGDLVIRVENAEENRDIYIDDSGYCWYSHHQSFLIPSNKDESNDDYTNRIVKTVADAIIEAFENEEAV